MSILALDLGTTTGWAWCDGKSLYPMMSGVWRMLASKSAVKETRFINMREGLTIFHAHRPVSRIYFEDVKRHAGTDAAHVYGTFKNVMKMWCYENGRIPWEGVGVGVIKKFWTGRGNAPKSLMVEECLNRGFKPQTDDEADAIALLHYAMRLKICGQ